MKVLVSLGLLLSVLMAHPYSVIATDAGVWEDCMLAPTPTCILALVKPMIPEIEDAEERAEAWSDFASAQFHARDFNGALATMNQIQIPEIRHEAQRDLVYGAAIYASRNHDNDLRIAKQMIAKVVPPDDRAPALKLVVELLAKSGRLDSAYETLEEIEPPLPRSEALVEIARVQFEAGQTLGALDDLSRAWDAALTIDSQVQRIEVMGEIARWQAEAGQLPLARENLEYALDLALGTDKPWLLGHPIEVYIRKLAKSGDIVDALEAVAMLREIEDWLLASRETPLGTETSRSSSIIRSIVVTQTEAGDIAGALETSTAYEGPLTTSRPAVRSIVVTLLKAKNLAAALDVTRGLEPSWVRVDCLSLISIAQAKAGQVNAAAETTAEALETAARLETRDDRHRALDEIVSGRLYLEDFAGALETVEIMRSRTDPSSAQGKIAAMYAHQGDFDSAVQLARRIEDDLERANALKFIVEKLVRADHIGDALALADTIERDGQRGSAQRRVSSAQIKKGDLEDALTTSRAITDPYYRADALEQVAISRAENGEHGKALETALAIEANKDAVKTLTAIAEYVAAPR